jgi:uncharacterized protein (DUF2147 family)
MIRFLCFAAALALTGSLAIPSARAEDMTGTWLTAQGEAHIKLAKCSGKMCATIVWIKSPVDAKTGKPPVDDKNPDPAKRGRKIMGMRIFAMDQDPSGAWTGPIYNADDGMTYKGRLSPRGDNELEVQGCTDSNLCGSEVWARVKDEVPAAQTQNTQNKK